MVVSPKKISKTILVDDTRDKYLVMIDDQEETSFPQIYLTKRTLNHVPQTFSVTQQHQSLEVDYGFHHTWRC